MNVIVINEFNYKIEFIYINNNIIIGLFNILILWTLNQL